MKAIYPFVGGTATTHKFNLKDPADINAAFRLVVCRRLDAFSKWGITKWD